MNPKKGNHRVHPPTLEISEPASGGVKIVSDTIIHMSNLYQKILGTTRGTRSLGGSFPSRLYTT